MRLFHLVPILALLVACDDKSKPAPEAKPAAPQKAAVVFEPDIPQKSEAQVAAGKAAIAKYECNRCHQIEDIKPPVMAKDCVGCHQAIIDGTYEAPSHKLDEWRSNIKSLLDAPTLTATHRFKHTWMVKFLQNPHDLRPRLQADMPIMPMTRSDADDIAGYLTHKGNSVGVFQKERVEEGKALTNQKGCWSCHSMQGVAGLNASPIPVEIDPKVLTHAMLMAPDLSHVDRMRENYLVAWLQDPKSVKPDSTMPSMNLSKSEAEAIAAFLVFTDPAPPNQPTAVQRPAPLGRKVGYVEIKEEVLDKVCAHCHLDQAHGNGDGGPGNTGGFGYEGKGLDFTRFAAARQGSKKREADRMLSTPIDGVPRLTAFVLERHNEVNGLDNPDIPGMPLGHPPLSMEQIQLLDAWVVSGMRPR